MPKPRPELLSSTKRSGASSRASPAPAAIRAESVSTFEALGRVLAADVRSLIDVPPADNSAMDGYALRVADVAAPGTVLPISQRIAAGSVGSPLAPGSAARIFTGAQVPPGADAVVMQEHCTAVDGGVRVDTVPSPGQSIRRRGEDVARDAVVLAAGVAPHAAGARHGRLGRRGELHGRARPRVALFSTGDELAMPGEALKPGAIYNSNRFTLRALIESLGARARRPRHRPRPASTPPATALKRAAETARPHRHLRRRLGRRRRPPEAGGRDAKAGSTSGRSRSSPASRSRSARSSAATAHRRGSSACRATRSRPSSPSCSRCGRCC